MDEDSKEYQELQEMIRRQFELALNGERPVFCAVCSRPFRCREVTAPTSAFRVVHPYRHAIGRGNRNICPGSTIQALLTPRKP